MPVTPYLQRQIQQITGKAVIQQRIERRFVGPDAIVKSSNDLQRGAKYYTFPIVNMQGRAAIISNNSFDVPSVDAFSSERTQQIELVYIPWAIYFTEEIHAEFAGHDIRGVSIELSVQSIMNRLDEIGCTGAPEVNIYGLANNPNAQSLVLPADGAGVITANPTNFVNKTGEQMLRDLNSIAYAVAKSTLHAYNTTVMAVPPSVWEQIVNTILSSSGTTQSVYATFIQNQEQMGVNGTKKIEVVPQLETAGPGGTPRIIAFNPRLDYVDMLKTGGIETRPTVQQVEGVKSAHYVYTGGVLMKHPISVLYVDNAA